MDGEPMETNVKWQFQLRL